MRLELKAGKEENKCKKLGYDYVCDRHGVVFLSFSNGAARNGQSESRFGAQI